MKQKAILIDERKRTLTGQDDHGKSGKEGRRRRRKVAPTFPLLWVTLVFSITFLLWLISTFYSHMNDETDRQLEYLEKERIKNDLLYYDKLLSLSAKMFSLTGAPHWENRYQQFAPRWQDVAQEAIRYSDKKVDQGLIDKATKAHKEVLKWEGKAFNLARRKDHYHAYLILSGPLYQKYKGEFLWNITAFDHEKDSLLQMEKLSGEAVYLDEEMAMSARLAIETGSIEWEHTYREYEIMLEGHLKMLSSLAPQIFKNNFADVTQKAFDHLVAVENKVFDLLKEGNRDGARRIMDSNEYLQNKKLYTDGLRGLRMEISKEVQSRRKRIHNLRDLQNVFLILGLILFFLLWGFLGRRYLKMQKLFLTARAPEPPPTP